jgi:hypothetical protein
MIRFMNPSKSGTVNAVSPCEGLRNMGFRDEVPSAARADAERQVNAHERLLEELIWQLFEFREKPKGSQS